MKKIDTLRQLQKVQLFIYKELFNVCKENNIKLYLCGGTLLGAVRHKAFIPWDDDVDVGMSRPDYKRLLEITKGNIGDKCKVVDPVTDADFKGYIPLVVYKNSASVSRQFKDKTPQQIGISIFVFDGTINPEHKLKRKIYYAKMYMLRAKHALCRADFKNVNTKAAKIVGPILSPFYKEEKVYKFKNKILKLQKKYSYEDNEYVCTNADYKASREYMLKTTFEKTVWLEYEGLKVMSFDDYGQYLTHYYGDYMQLPPEESRKPKHSFVAEIEDEFDFDWQ